MKEDSDASSAAELRRRAEEKLKAAEDAAYPAIAEPELVRLVHDLQVHQIELELQNEELRQAKDNAEVWQERYTDLYDFSPVGYFTLDRQGDIRQANLTGSSLLGMERSRLVGTRFTLWVSPEFRPAFNACLASTFGSHAKQKCEVVLEIEPSAPIYARIDAVYKDSEECRVAVIDITERKQAEEALRKSQKTFYELVEGAPFGIYIIDSQFRIAHMNAGSQNGAFQNVRPVIGRDFSEAMHILWPEPVAAEIIALFRHTLETGEPYYSPRFTSPRHDIEIRESYEWELHRVTLPSGEYGVVCYYFDSTELRDAQEALLRQQDELDLKNSQLQALFDYSAASLVLFDAVRPYKVLAHNKYYQELWAEPYRTEGMVGKNLFDFVPEAEASGTMAIFDEVAETKQAKNLLGFPYDGMDRGRTWWNWHLSPVMQGDKVIALAHVGIDVTNENVARIEAEQRAHEAEEGRAILNALMEYAPEGITISSAPDVTTVMTSRYGDDLLTSGWDTTKGMSMEDWLAKVEHFLTDGVTPAGTQDLPLWRAVKCRETVVGQELILRRPDGEPIWVSCNAGPIRDADGNVTGGVVTWRDITDRKKAEEEARRLAAEVQQEKDRLSTLIDSISDEIWFADADKRLVLVNPAVMEEFGVGPSEMAEVERIAAHYEIYRPDGSPRPVDEAPLLRALNGEVVQDQEEIIKTPAADELRHRSANAAPVRDADGNIIGSVSVVRDITERKKAEQALLELEAHKRDFYRKTILAATGGRLDVVEPQDIPTPHEGLVRTWRFSAPDEYSLALVQSFEQAETLGLADDRLNRFMSCAGEMLGNAQKHAGGGEAAFYKTDNHVLFVVSDTGPGIESVNLPEVAFVRGYSTAGTAGLGYKLIIGCADKTYLATGENGTTVAVEMSLVD